MWMEGHEDYKVEEINLKAFIQNIDKHYINCQFTESQIESYQTCIRNYVNKTEKLDESCERLIGIILQGTGEFVKAYFEKENITECGWKLVKDHKVDEIAGNAFTYTTSLVNITKTNFDSNKATFFEEMMKTFKYLVEVIRSYCNPEVYIGNNFKQEVEVK
ncbi:CLUMA_CG020776, isoform A [Clunio marinus]|uniref:CLUMA_CG020776, isoform A n=1 Tax=Clunio marinus TaxID=568069 RepID=A0A1J1J8N3_9DIPT|nr:CLUMA_CG020776, isoform A [Clunio marinus]